MSVYVHVKWEKKIRVYVHEYNLINFPDLNKSFVIYFPVARQKTIQM